MLSLTMDQLAHTLGGRWELQPTDGDACVDRFLIGGNIMDSGAGYFGRFSHQVRRRLLAHQHACDGVCVDCRRIDSAKPDAHICDNAAIDDAEERSRGSVPSGSLGY